MKIRQIIGANLGEEIKSVQATEGTEIIHKRRLHECEEEL
jgi:hypothetical protein